MTIGDICRREVVFVNRDVTIHAACRLMRHYQVGSLVVVDEVNEADGKRVPVGIVTDRDIVVEVDAMDLDAKVMTAGDIMSPNLVTALESLSLTDTIELMRTRGIRCMPVVDEDNRLVGIVTMDDLLAVLARALSGIAGVVSGEPVRATRVHTK